MKILLLDDDVHITNALKKLLSKKNHVETSNTPLDALALLSAKNFDLLICDWDLGANQLKGHKFIDSVCHLFRIICILYTGEINPPVGRNKPIIIKKPNIKELLNTIDKIEKNNR